MARHRRNDREDGFTLIELLLTVSIGGLLAVALMTTVAVSFQAADSTSARFEESQDAQIAAAYFAADVAGSNRIAATACGVPPPSATIVDLEAVDGSIVSYERVVEHARPQLVRRSCDPAGQIINETIMSHHLGDVSPHVICAPTSCAPGSSPRRVQLVVTEASGFDFALLGVRRDDATVATTTTAAASTTVAPSAGGRFVILNNASKVVTTSGGSVITVHGDAQIRSSASDWLNGPATGFSVTGSMTIGSAVDPYSSLIAPDEAGLPVYTDGEYHGPGVYRDKPLTIDSPTTLAPGTYILEDGLTVPGGNRVSGSNVLLFNGCGLNAPPSCVAGGRITISGGSTADLTGPTSGPYAGILFFQDRLNTQVVTVSGGSLVTALAGALYAPNSTKVILGSGGSELSISQVVAQVVEASGGSRITVGP